MNAGTPIAERWVIKYDDAEVDDDVFIGEGAREAALRTYAARTENWNCYLFCSYEELSAAEERERVLREALREARQSHSGCCIVIPSLQTAWQNMGKIVISGRDIPSSDYRCAACRIIDDALATPAPEQPAKKESE